MDYLLLFLFGIIVGSFSNALIYRLKNGKAIVFDRSMCTKCNHTLGLLDLAPILSWVFLRGKCRYCNNVIGFRYIVTEILFGLFFMLSGYLLNSGQLAFAGDVGLVILLFVTSVLLFISIYDVLYLEIHDSVIVPATAFLFVLIIFDLSIADMNSSLFGAFVIYSFFYVQIFIPGIIYLFKCKTQSIKNGDSHSCLLNKSKIISGQIWIGVGKLLISYFLFPIWFCLRVVFSEKTLDKVSIFKEDEALSSLPAWIGGGDLRMAIFMGLLLGWQLSLSALILSYLIGAIVGMILKLYGIFKGKKVSTVPFLPFLSIGTYLTLIYGQEVIDFYFGVL